MQKLIINDAEYSLADFYAKIKILTLYEKNISEVTKFLYKPGDFITE